MLLVRGPGSAHNQRHGGQYEQSIPSTHTPPRSREEISHVLGNRRAVDRRLMGGEVFRCAWREREDADPSCRHANRRRDRLSIFRETVSFLFPSAVRAIRRCSTSRSVERILHARIDPTRRNRTPPAQNTKAPRALAT